MKILYFAFNAFSDDHSGLPTYSEKFMQTVKCDNIDLFTINIIADPEKIDHTEKFSDRIDVYFSKFFWTYSSDIEHVIKEAVDSFDPDVVLMQDYMCEPYMSQFYDVPHKFKKGLFIHLCQAGLMFSFMRQPFFDNTIQQGMGAMSDKCWCEWRAISSADFIIANSDFTKRDIEKFYPESHGKITSIPLGVDVDAIQYSPALDSKKWAYFGRLDVQKGINFIIKDFMTYPDEYRKNPLIVLGDGSLCTQMLKAQHFDGFVDFRGNVDKKELSETLRDVKYCIFPSIYEPYCLALNEALAMGKICLVHNADSGMLEQLYDDENFNACAFDMRNGIIKVMLHLEETLSKEIFEKTAENARRCAFQEDVHFGKLKDLLLSL